MPGLSNNTITLLLTIPLVVVSWLSGAYTYLNTIGVNHFSDAAIAGTFAFVIIFTLRYFKGYSLTPSERTFMLMTITLAVAGIPLALRYIPVLPNNLIFIDAYISTSVFAGVSGSAFFGHKDAFYRALVEKN